MKDTFYGRNRSATPDVPDEGDLALGGELGGGGELPEDIAALESGVVAQQPGLGSIREPLFAPGADGEDEDELAALAEAEAEAAMGMERARPRAVDMGDAPPDITEEDEW